MSASPGEDFSDNGDFSKFSLPPSKLINKKQINTLSLVRTGRECGDTRIFGGLVHLDWCGFCHGVGRAGLMDQSGGPHTCWRNWHALVDPRLGAGRHPPGTSCAAKGRIMDSSLHVPYRAFLPYVPIWRYRSRGFFRDPPPGGGFQPASSFFSGHHLPAGLWTPTPGGSQKSDE